MVSCLHTGQKFTFSSEEIMQAKTASSTTDALVRSNTVTSLFALLAFTHVAVALMLCGSTVMAQQQPSNRNQTKAWTGANPMARARQTDSQFHDRQIESNNHDVGYRVVTIPVLPGKTNSFLPDAKSVNNLGHATGYSFVHT